MANIEMLEGQLNRFIMFDDETPQDMFKRLKKMVNKAKALGYKQWTDRMLIERLIRAYTPMNYNVVALICQDPTYKRMTSNDVLRRIINHEMYNKEANHIKNLYKGVSTTKKQDIALKESNKGKMKQIVIESSSEEEEEEDEEKEYDEDEMALFIKKFNKYLSKRRPFKGDRIEKTRSKSVCYNYGKSGHFIAQCPYERKDEDNDKKKKIYKSYRMDKKYTKKKSCRQAHVDQEWNSSDAASKSKSDDLATIAIKGKSSSSKSLFPNLPKYTCLMTKEGKKKVKTNTPSSPKYVTSDEYTLSSDDDDSLPCELCKNPNAMIKGHMKQVGVRDEFLEQQEELFVQEIKSNEEFKKLLALQKSKVEKLDQELAQSKETTCILKSSIGALQGQHDVFQKTHQDLEVQFNALWSSTSKTSSDPKVPKASTSKGCQRCYNLDLNVFCDKVQPSKVEQVLVESCDEAIGKENDHLKREVKKPQLEVKKLKNVDVSYAAPQAHGIVNVALHREYSLGVVFIFSHGRKDLYHV
jgi:hypothetical protein